MDQLELIAMMVAVVPRTWWQNTLLFGVGRYQLVGVEEEEINVGISILTSAVIYRKG
jgi:hypothetical protein